MGGFMRLKNKRTGKIIEAVIVDHGAEWEIRNLYTDEDIQTYNSLAELNSEWEDAPEEPKKFWYITAWGDVYEYSQSQFAIKQKQAIGNYFETEEEAKKAVERLRAWKRLKDNGFKIKGWKFTPDMEQIQGNYVKIEAEIPQILINEKDIDLLFGGEE